MRHFGELLRKIRLESEMTMGDVARHLGVSVPYVSDVERGNRPPLTRDKIKMVADLFGVNPKSLDIAAAACRGAFELPNGPSMSPKAGEVGAALMRGWTDLTDEDLEKIEAIVSKRKG